MDFTRSSPVIIGEPTKKSTFDKIFDNTLFLSGGIDHNLKLAVDGGDVGKLWVYAQSTGALPGATSPIGVLIPDGDELQIRQRTAAYLSGRDHSTLPTAPDIGGGHRRRPANSPPTFTRYGTERGSSGPYAHIAE